VTYYDRNELYVSVHLRSGELDGLDGPQHSGARGGAYVRTRGASGDVVELEHSNLAG